jgi:hypothetical protein
MVEIRAPGPTNTWDPPPSPPFALISTLHHPEHISTKKSTNTCLSMKQRRIRRKGRSFGHYVGPAGPTTCLTGLCQRHLQMPPLLAGLCINHNCKQASQVRNPKIQFCSLKIHLVEVILELGKKRKF